MCVGDRRRDATRRTGRGVQKRQPRCGAEMRCFSNPTTTCFSDRESPNWSPVRTSAVCANLVVQLAPGWRVRAIPFERRAHAARAPPPRLTLMATCSRASVPRASPRARDADASRRAVWSRRASRTYDARAGRAPTHARDAFPPSVGGRSSYASLWTVEEASSRPPPARYASAPRRLALHGASASADRPLVLFTSADPRDDDGDPSSVPSSSSAVLPPPPNNNNC